MQKAVSSVASRLEQYESGKTAPVVEDTIPTPSRRFGDYVSDDFTAFTDPQPYVAPMDAAQPLRAAPIPPRARQPTPAAEPDLDIYFAEESETAIVGEAPPEPTPMPEAKAFGVMDDDDLLIDDTVLEDLDAFAPPPPDDDPFWTPEDELTVQPETSAIVETPTVETGEDGTPTLDLSPPTFDTEPPPEPLTVAEPPAAPGKNDYLAAARRAAQAQSQVKTREPKAAKAPRTREAKSKETTAPALRGRSRVVLWVTTGAIAALMLGGGWYLNQQRNAAAADEGEPVQPPAPVAPYTAPAEDPFALQADPGAEAPAGEAAPAQAEQVVAGPLAPRAITLEQAAQSGNLVAQYELALQRLSAGRTQEGVNMMRAVADRGLVMAQYRMAKLYERGEGVAVDLTVARQWTERAAAGGNRRAMHDLGVYFARGEGAPRDEAAAFRWFRQAAELGVADSQYNLGVLYQQGRGVGANPAEALFWFLVAARQGDQDAATRAEALEATVAPIQVEQARARAQSFRPRAAIAVANGDFGPRPWATRAPA